MKRSHRAKDNKSCSFDLAEWLRVYDNAENIGRKLQDSCVVPADKVKAQRRFNELLSYVLLNRCDFDRYAELHRIYKWCTVYKCTYLKNPSYQVEVTKGQETTRRNRVNS